MGAGTGTGCAEARSSGMSGVRTGVRIGICGLGRGFGIGRPDGLKFEALFKIILSSK